MANGSPESAFSRVAVYWRRVLSGPPIGSRIEIYEELAPTLAAGIGLREALRLSAGRHGGRKQRALALLDDGIARDAALSETMRANPESFSPLEAAIVSTGERTGRLDAAMRAAAAELERQRGTRNRLVQACAYPLVLLHCLILIPTLGMIAASRGLGAWLAFVVPAILLLWAVLLGAVTFVVAFSGRPWFARAVGAVPVVGRAVKSASLARFARALGALHGAGVTYDESLRIAAEASGHAVLAAEADAAVVRLRAGATFAEAVSGMSSIPAEDCGLLLAGEGSGELEASAARVAELEDQRFDVATKRAIAVLPTVLVGLVGIAVAVIAFQVIGGYYRSLTEMMR